MTDLMFQFAIALLALGVGIGSCLGVAIGIYAGWLALRREFFNADGTLRQRDQ